MKKIAYVIVDDFMHPARRVMPVIHKMFNRNLWHVCVLSGLDSICSFKGSPDLIVNFKDGQENWRMETPNWYECQFAYQFSSFVKKNGCGYLAVHSGLEHIPSHHPVRNELLMGSVDVEEGKPPFFGNMLFPAPGANPFGCFSDVTFVPEGEHPILKDVKEFTIRDEQYRIALRPDSGVQVLGRTRSSAGESIGCWVNEAGEGRVCGISMGHLPQALEATPMVTLLRNAVEWCGGLIIR